MTFTFDDNKDMRFTVEDNKDMRFTVDDNKDMRLTINKHDINGCYIHVILECVILVGVCTITNN